MNISQAFLTKCFVLMRQHGQIMREIGICSNSVMDNFIRGHLSLLTGGFHNSKKPCMSKMRIFFSLFIQTFCKRLRFETNDDFKKLQPNIVFVLFDDVGWADLGFNNFKITTTPFMDKMTRQGTKLTQVRDQENFYEDF